MIPLHRLNGTQFILNAELIEQIESTPDTVITLTTGNNILVKEDVSAVVDLVLTYRRQIRRLEARPVEETLKDVGGR